MLERESKVRGAGRGVLAGLVAGATWWAVEAAMNRLLGGLVPGPTALAILGLDLGLGAFAGLVSGALLARIGQGGIGTPLALVLAATWGFFRVYEPPGAGAEAVFAVAAGVAVTLGVRLAGRERAGRLAFVHVGVLATVATALGEALLDETHATALRGVRLPLALAALPLAGVAADRLLALGLRRRDVRLGVELAAAALAAVVWGRPLTTAPVDDALITAVPPPAGTPDVILVSLDTTRADHLSTYGYARDTSPNLTAFAADGLQFLQARSPAAWTLPGHASLFTGMYPTRHGAHLAGGWLAGQSIDGRRNVAFPLPEDRVTMAEALRDRGYLTAGVVANFSYLYRDFGVAQGFGHYDDAPALLLRVHPHVVRFAQRFAPGFCLKPFRGAPDINAAALAWLDHAPAGRPVFLFVNYMEPHEPWLAPAPYDRWARGLPDARRLARQNLYTHAVHDLTPDERAFITANYDGQLAAMDAALGELLAALKARGRYENALVVVTADHGEFLGEHGQVGHIGRMLYEPVLHVPLVVKLPGAAHLRGRNGDPVQLVDVLPTVLAVAGAPVPPDVQGEALPHVSHASFAEEDINPFLVSRYGSVYDRAVRVIYDGDWKLITTSRGARMLFDLAHDPEEAQDLAAREPERVAALAARLEAQLDTMVAAAAARSNRQMN